MPLCEAQRPRLHQETTLMDQVIKGNDLGNVSDLRDACWEALIERYPELSASSPGALRLAGADRRPLSLSSRLADVLSNGDDVFYQISGSAARDSAPRASVSAGDSGANPACKPTGPLFGSPTTDAPPVAQAVRKTTVGSAAVPSEPATPHTRQTSGSLPAEAGAEAAPEPSAQAAGGGGDSKPGGPAERRSATATVGDSITASASSSVALLPVVRALWLRAEELAGLLHYRGAAEVLQQALLLVPEPSSPTHIATLVRLARMWLAAGNPAAAVQWALRAAQERPSDPGVLELAGDCLREGGRPLEAAAQYQSALEALQEEGEHQQLLQQQAAGAEGRQGAEALTGRLRLSLAACLAVLPGSLTPPYGNQDLAASLVMSVLERDPGDWEALRLYARIALDRGLREDALRVALRLVVGRPKHAGAKALLAECLPDEASCGMLYKELGVALHPAGQQPVAALNGSGSGGKDSSSSSSTAAALAFVATAVKDFGKVDTCVALLRRTVHLEPRNPSYSLNLVHALELRQDLQGALQAGRSYCRLCGTQLAGRPLREVDELLSRLPELRDPLSLTWYSSRPLWGPEARPLAQQAQQAQARREGTAERAEQRPGGSTSSSDGDGSGALREGVTIQQQAPAAAGPVPAKVSYSSDQLDELALLFTLCKVLFVGGALEAAARLCDLVEPLRSASSAELHTTLIRNEAAYFGCVVQLLRDHPPPPPPPPLPDADSTSGSGSGSGSPARLYLCGDSHCLSAAWRMVTLRGERLLLRPVLVTGCKVWHLRPASEFYPKKQFETSLRLLPDGAPVVLVLGEIDCREGLLLAVQKGKYKSVAEGIDATVAIYLDVLRRMVLERGMEVFVHPVPPVLNETRAVVAPFTAALRAGVIAAREADPMLRNRLHYLNFFDQLLVPRGQQEQHGPAATAAAVAPPTSTDITGAGANAADVEIERLRAAAAASGSELVGKEVPEQEQPVERKEHAGNGAVAGGAAAAPAGPVAADPASAAGGAAGWALRPDLAFDGTHLAPLYVPLLDETLSSLP